MEPNDGFRNSSSSDDDDLSPLRKKIRIDSVSADDSTQGEYRTSTEQYTQETVLTGASWDAAEASESVAESGVQQTVVSIVTDDNNNDSLATDQNTHKMQIDTNDSVSDDTNTDSALSLESTLQPDTRYVIPQNLLYRPSISELTTKQNIPNSANETDNKQEKPNMTKSVSINIEQIRHDFIRSWDRIDAADDLIPAAELQNLDSTVPEHIYQYLDDLGATNSTNEGLRELIPMVCDEINHLQQRDESLNEFHSFEPEPEPEPEPMAIPISAFLADPLELLENTHQNPVTGEEFEFNVSHWNRIQEAFLIPDQGPSFDELFANNGILIPDNTQDGSRNDGAVDYQSVPHELANIYNTIIRMAGGNQHSTNVSTPSQSAARNGQSADAYLRNNVNTGSTSTPKNCEADLYRSLLGIPSPFERKGNTSNEQVPGTELDNVLNRSVERQGVPPQTFGTLSQVEPNTAECDMNIAESESTPEENSTEFERNPRGLVPNPSAMETNSVEGYSTPADFEMVPPEMRPSSSTLITQPSEMEINITAFDTNIAELNTSPAEVPSNPVLFGANSDQEDSDASTPPGSDDDEAQFVVVPRRNNFKPVKILIMNPTDAADAPNANNVPTEESTSDEIADSAQPVTNDEEEVDPANNLVMQEMHHFDGEMSTVESEINIIIEAADRFEQQAARFEETAGDFPEVESFFRQVSEIFEFAATSLQEAVDNFETLPIDEDSDIADNLDPLSEGLPTDDGNDPDQEVPDIEPNDS